MEGFLCLMVTALGHYVPMVRHFSHHFSSNHKEGNGTIRVCPWVFCLFVHNPFMHLWKFSSTMKLQSPRLMFRSITLLICVRA